ncbi:hypothetical protein [Streptomyces sp. NPDC055709]
MAANEQEIRLSLEGERIPAPSALTVNNNNELTWTASASDEQTSFLLTFIGNVSKREVTAAAKSTKVAIPTDLAESRYLVEARAVKNGIYSPPTGTLKIKDSSAPEDLKISGLDQPQDIATDGVRLYIANRTSGKITKTDMDGKNAVTVFDKLETPMGIATNGGLLWVATQGSGGAITGYATYGSCSKVSEPAKGKSGINYLSFSDSGFKHSSAGEFDNPLFFTSEGKGWAAWGYGEASMCREIVTDLSGARGMTCDGTFLYIASRDQNKVIRARVDGTRGKEDFITVTKPEDISHNARHLYVTTDDGMLIRASRLNGTIDQNFTIRNLNKPRGVQVGGNYVYFVEQGANRISRVFVGWTVE